MSERGVPTPVAWTRLRPPRSRMAPADPAAVRQAVAASPLQAEYGTEVDRESAYERLAARLAPPPAPVDQPGPAPQPPAPDPGPEESGVGGLLGKVLGSPAARSFARSAATVLGREITRGVLGTARRRGRRTRRR
jgi:DNA double-strand break repair helicase HerA and related ATPase